MQSKRWNPWLILVVVACVLLFIAQLSRHKSDDPLAQVPRRTFFQTAERMNCRYSDTFYGQYQPPLDKLLLEHLPHCGGTFIDIGANDGLTFDNTRYFEANRGWTGFCLEPNPTIFAQLSKNRPNCKNLNMGVGAETKKVTYVGPPHGFLGAVKDALNDKHLERMHNEAGTEEVLEYDVQIISLVDLFERFMIKEVDLMNIDVEGYEYDVVKSIQPNMLIKSIIMEFEGTQQHIMANDRLINLGYRIVFENNGNRFYILDR